MKDFVKRLLKNTPLYVPIRDWRFKKYDQRQLKMWEDNAHHGFTPHIIKERVLIEFATKYNLKVFVETGTYYGDMVEALKNYFDKIYSIELDQYLFKVCKKKFKSKNHIELIHGDSSEKLKEVIKKISQPALFWLDGHYSGDGTARGHTDTPIYAELNEILDSKDLRHVVIIDDAREFGNNTDYSNIDKLKKFIHSKRENVSIDVKYDIIRIVPND